MGHSLGHFPENSLKLFYSGQLQCWGGMRGDYLVFSGQALYMFPNMDFIFGTSSLRKQMNKYTCLWKVIYGAHLNSEGVFQEKGSSFFTEHSPSLSKAWMCCEHYFHDSLANNIDLRKDQGERVFQVRAEECYAVFCECKFLRCTVSGSS